MARHPALDHLEREEKTLLEKIPHWKDPKKATAEMAEIRKALVDHYGFAPHAVEVIPNHQSVLVARDAVEARSLRGQLKQLKAQLAEQKKAQAADAKDQQIDEDFKRRLAETRRHHGGKAPLHEQIADWVETKERGA